MIKKPNHNHSTRRRFIGTSLATVGAAALGMANEKKTEIVSQKQKLNVVFILCDQLSLDSVQAYGCPHVRTPNINRLMAQGMSFFESYSTSPVCSPARSSLVTGRMPIETGVVGNDRAIHPSVPTMGQWFRKYGYETVYCGKWHLPETYAFSIDGFDVLPSGAAQPAQGDLIDGIVSRNCHAYLESRDKNKPFLLVASLMQPHDICYWAIHNQKLVPESERFGLRGDAMPPLPLNWNSTPMEPRKLKECRYEGFNEFQWRYYAYCYYRQIEMLDADVGRILDAVEMNGLRNNTLIVFTSDHGEGLGRHKLVQKWHPYEESMKVPLVIATPSLATRGRTDSSHLVSGIDLMPTLCDAAEIPSPPNCCGESLMPFIEGKSTTWRRFLSADTNFGGQILRTDRYKYVRYPEDAIEMLFDLKEDPGETRNLYNLDKYAKIRLQHQKLLKKWNNRLIPVEPSPSIV